MKKIKKEIRVGDYIRDKDGNIGRVLRFTTKDIFYVQFYDNLEWKTDLDELGDVEINADIKNLIHEEDYVNGFKVLEILSHSPQLIFTTYRYNGHHYTKILDNEDIETIATKEQFSSIEYRIGE